MEKKIHTYLLLINALILLAVLFVLVNKEPVYVESQSTEYNPGTTFEPVQIGEGIIAVIDTEISSSSYGELFVLEYDAETQSFNRINQYDIFADE
ncbi:hypothetical protein GCM10008932_14740 [Alkalibacterium iburiense]|uniref:Uncharacterized protein n=1 Tax=Alkalibacterium iburiense TaxID=290589 RepID=A0ABN0XG73_9LACT